jgi:hypothetical protein
VRLFLQVETLSDVSNALGTELQKDLWSKTSMVQSQLTLLEEVPSKVHNTEKRSSTALSTRQLDKSNKENMGSILQLHQQQHSCAAQNGITAMEQVHSTEITS